MNKQYINCKIKIDIPTEEFQNNNQIRMPTDVFQKALDNLTNAPIVYNQQPIGFFNNYPNATLWINCNPEITINKTHKEDNITVIDDLTILAVNINI